MKPRDIERAKRVFAVRQSDPTKSMKSIARELGLSESVVNNDLHYVRRTMGLHVPAQVHKRQQPPIASAELSERRSIIRLIIESIGEQGLAVWLGVPLERARKLRYGSSPTDEEQQSIDKAFVIARVRLLDLTPGDFMRFDAMGRREMRRRTGELSDQGASI